jgi:tol-pal system protein YbgF
MRLLLPLLLLFFCSASQAGLFADNDARDEIVKLRQYVKETQDARITDLQNKLDASEKARQALEQRLNEQKSQAVDLLAQIDRLNAEISKLRGQLEVNSHDIELAQQRQKDLYADLDGRLRKLEGGPAAAAKPADTTSAPTSASSAQPAAAAPAAATVVPQSATPVTDNSAAEIKSYEAALDLSKANKHKEAIDAFESFIGTYPESKYASSAQYWIGYSHFSQKNYKAAIVDQQKLIKTYPDSHKIPDAMYNMANSQIQLSDIDAAKKALREIVVKYPLSDVAPLAKKRLAVLESVKSK